MPYSLRACHPGFRHDGVGPIDPVDLVKSASSVDKVCRRENITGFYPSAMPMPYRDRVVRRCEKRGLMDG